MTDTPDAQPITVAIQSVLYRNDPAHIERGMLGICLSASLALRQGHIASWSVTLGDCSEKPVLDDTTQDRLRSLAEGHGGSFNYEFFGENLGHGGGHNRLAIHSTESVLAFINPDGLADPACIAEMARAITAGAGIVDGRQLPMEHPKEYDPVTGITDWTSGAVMMLARDLFDKVGGFDAESFFLYGDDVDLSWRVRLAGHSAVHVPSARLFHDKRLDVNAHYSASEAEHYYSAEASLLLAAKYSREDVVDQTRKLYLEEARPEVLKALAEFDRRKSEGLLAEPIDPDHRVARFNDGYYGAHRF